jgi:hypothetical protein
MVDLFHATANPADQVMVIMVSHLVNQLPVAEVSNQYQALFATVQGAVDGAR